MASLLYTKFDYEGEQLGLVDYIDRILGMPHPIRTIKEEERAVQNAIERPVISIHRNACERLGYDAAVRARDEIAEVVDIVRRYTWLSEGNIWCLAYGIFMWETITPSMEGEE